MLLRRACAAPCNPSKINFAKSKLKLASIFKRNSADRMPTNFDRLLARVRACTECARYLPLGPRPVIRLSKSVRVLIISQAPGTRVHKSGLPFDDVSGDRLREWLGLNCEEFYDETKVGFMPMGFCYPGKGKGGDLPPRPECAPKWHDLLRAELKDVQLTLLIGSYAIARYWPDSKGKTLTEIVKRWNGESVVPLVHPSPRNKLWVKKNPWFESEMLPSVRDKLLRTLS